MHNAVYNVIGAIGSVLIFLGFYRTSIGRWKNRSFIYELDNVVGAIFVIIYQLHFHAYISVGLNFIWAFVAFRGLSSFTERYLSFHRTGAKKRHPKK